MARKRSTTKDRTRAYDLAMRASGPLVWWRFADAVGSAKAHDESGNGHDGTLVPGSGSATFGQPGLLPYDAATSLRLTGNAQVRSDLPLVTVGQGTKHTWLGWAYREGIGADYVLAGLVGGRFALRFEYGPGGSSQIALATLRTTGANGQQWPAVPKANPGLAFHWALTWDDATAVAELYVDGVSSGTRTFVSVDATEQLGVGQVTFAGRVQDFAAYDRILTAAEIHAIFDAAYAPRLVIAPEPARQNARIELRGVPATAARYTLVRASPSGAVAGVRGAVNVPPEGEPTIVRDYEIPLDVQVVYTATFYNDQGDVVGTASAPFTLVYGACPAWLVDLAAPTNSLQLVIESFSPLDFEVPAGVHRVLDRRAPVLVTLAAWTPEAELALLTDTQVQRDAVRSILGSGYPVLLRTSPSQGIGNMYLGVIDFKEDRILTMGAAAPRRFTVDVVQVERPDPAVFQPRAPNTYQNVLDHFTSYADLLAVVGTYDVLAYTFPDGVQAPPIPWLPVDV